MLAFRSREAWAGSKRGPVNDRGPVIFLARSARSVRQRAYATCTAKPNAGTPNAVAHTRCAGAAPLAPPSAKSLVVPTVSLPAQSAAQAEHPVIAIEQHVGSAKPTTSARQRWFKRWWLSDIRRRLGLPGYISEENPRELCSDSENRIQATLAGGIGGLHKAGGWGREGDVHHHPVVAMGPDRHHPLSLALSSWFRQIGDGAMGPI
jgi:hypothetical protein